MTTDKKIVSHLAKICLEKGMENLVISPGSRNAPLVNAFSDLKEVNCKVVVDERSAAYYALGIAQQSNKPVGLVCSSGTSVMNYGAAIIEAFYQKLPLIVMTADRPVEWIDQGDGQTIRQNHIFNNHILKSVQLPENPNDENDVWYSDRVVNEAINISTYPQKGPVHLNVPLREPLYETEHLNVSPKIINEYTANYNLDENSIRELRDVFKDHDKIMVITGMIQPSKKFQNAIKKLGNYKNVIILTETTSNIFGNEFIPCIDRTLTGIKGSEEEFKPDLLITTGGQIISKKVKFFLRDHPPEEHWHIDPNERCMDTFCCLTRSILCPQDTFFNTLLKGEGMELESNYHKRWIEVMRKTTEKHEKFLGKTKHCDLKVFEILLDLIPENSQLQLGNSTPIRYVQLFNKQKNRMCFSNRGTSGIDGTVSTAVGASEVVNQWVTLITGD
ncbi:MAG: 2-succinyl-5-enolpyruvyl-6-hydroxy-3-cyclohexene-1-carboxylic-acid synthase, partial [Flavobacteriales bacterium]